MPSTIPNQPLSTVLRANEQLLRTVFTDCSDIVFRPIEVNGKPRVLMVYTDGLVRHDILDESVLKPLFYMGVPQGLGKIKDIAHMVHRQLVPVGQTSIVSSLIDITTGVLQGHAAFLLDGENEALLVDIKYIPARNIEEPTNEVTIRGPRQGFTEVLRTNTVLLRRGLPTARLKLEPYTVGDFSRTNLVIAYVEGVVSPKVLKEVQRRISHMRTNGLLAATYVEELIEDAPFSPFPQLQNTERPDTVVGSLLEGKVAILVDGSPSALIAPMTFWAGLQAAEDEYERFLYTTLMRWLRFILFLMSLLLPSFFVALTTFHPEMLPSTFLLSVATSREESPFPAVVEALIMEFVFEALREAGIRLPSAIGSTVSIVGALVIGESAVQAGFVSAPMVIVISATGICSFAVPRYNLAIAFRMLRFPILILSGVLGFYGMLLGVIAMCIHLVNLESFGVPYLAPVAPFTPRKWKDAIVRAPRWEMPTGSVAVENESDQVKPSNRRHFLLRWLRSTS